MTDVAGLVIGVVAAWETCVQVFEIIDSGKKYGMDYEVLRVKLEVERIRLLVWGEAVGLSEVEQGSPSPDGRLNRKNVRDVVLRLLGCIQHVFEHLEELQDRYGLRPVQPTTVVDAQDGRYRDPPTQSQLILGPIFKRAYEGLRLSAKNRQRITPLTRKTIWAVYDKKKFQTLIAEIKDFNDALEALFPDLSSKTAHLIHTDIDRSVEIRDLQILQEATADNHGDISETASMRLEKLGSTVSLRAQTVTGEGGDEEVEGVITESADMLTKELDALSEYVHKKNEGALTLSTLGPQSYSARVTAYADWNRKQPRLDAFWDDLKMTFVKLSHPSFALYRGHTFIKRDRRDRNNHFTDEDYILLDIESSARYESVHIGTVTVEGFGMECWDYEAKFGKPRDNTIFVSYADMPNLPAEKLLRRLSELRRGGGKFGWHPKQEEADLKEFTGTMGITYYGDAATDKSLRIGDLFSLLNRTDIFADFTKKSSIALAWGGPKGEGIGLWNLLWQIIVAKELALRLEQTSSTASGYTPRVLASLIISKLWLTNVEIILEDSKINPEDMAKPTQEESLKAEGFKVKGNDAMKAQKYKEAVDLYTEGIKIDLSNAIYRSNRSAAHFSAGMVEEAHDDAILTTLLDPHYAKGWSRLGFTELKRGNGKRAREAYQRAIEVAGDEATAQMKQGLADSNAKIDADLKAIEEETDMDAKDNLRKSFLDQDWDILGKVPELHSHVHEQQVDGLLFFAERMKWSYINETRDFAEDAYAKLRSGETVPMHLHDWLFGMMLPGRWMSFKIMTALIHCTPSIDREVGMAYYSDCGLSVPKQSYWRVRTVLGRVLGCLPGLVSLCGWIGPCPPVEFNPPLAEKKPRHVRLKARPVVPIVSFNNNSDDGVFYAGGQRLDPVHIQPGEEMEDYLAQMKDPDSWVTPQPPVKEVSTVSIKGIYLKKMALEVRIAANKELTEQEVANETEYRASIVFSIDDNEDPVTYVLYTNPVFVSSPACEPTGDNGTHQVHLRELPRFQKNPWTVERLKNHTPDDFEDNEVMVINATGKGAEVLARAWCAERGKNAIIRRAGGPCFVCAVRGAGQTGLKVGVLIWAS